MKRARKVGIHLMGHWLVHALHARHPPSPPSPRGRSHTRPGAGHRIAELVDDLL